MKGELESFPENLAIGGEKVLDVGCESGLGAAGIARGKWVVLSDRLVNDVGRVPDREEADDIEAFILVELLISGDLGEAGNVFLPSKAVGGVDEASKHHAGKGTTGAIGGVVLEECSESRADGLHGGVMDGADGFVGDLRILIGDELDEAVVIQTAESDDARESDGGAFVSPKGGDVIGSGAGDESHSGRMAEVGIVVVILREDVDELGGGIRKGAA